MARFYELLRDERYCLKLPEELRPVAAIRYPGSRLLPSHRELAGYEDLLVVGDTLTRSLFREGVRPRLAVVDCREKRIVTRCPDPPAGYSVLRTWNPPATITSNAVSVLNRALADGSVMVVVDGEEDLMVLPLVVLAPLGSIVAYGLPGAGVVAVRVDLFSKRVALGLLDSMPLARCSGDEA